MQPIALLPVPSPGLPSGLSSDRETLARLATHLRTLLHSPVELHVGELDPAVSFDISRNQYNSTAILFQILRHFGSFEGKILAVTGVDLFVPVLTYVFGEAQLDGRAAVVSTFRLDETLYGFPANPALFEQRLVKEAMHELGHTFGLYHCHDFGCVMHSSTAVEEIDLKGERFCAECEKKVLISAK